MGLESLAYKYVPSDYEGGRELHVPANYGTDGSQAAWNWRAVHVPAHGPKGKDPSIPLDNNLDPIIWTLIVPTEETGFQAALQQNNDQRPMLFVAPGTASLDFKG